jgi:uncharacterized membrane protein YgaE (UPF0421/DUF939 family)
MNSPILVGLVFVLALLLAVEIAGQLIVAGVTLIHLLASKKDKQAVGGASIDNFVDQVSAALEV